MRAFEIYYSDLNEDAQKRFVETFGEENASDMYRNVYPIAAYYDFTDEEEVDDSSCNDCQEFDCYGCDRKEKQE